MCVREIKRPKIPARFNCNGVGGSQINHSTNYEEIFCYLVAYLALKSKLNEIHFWNCNISWYFRCYENYVAYRQQANHLHTQKIRCHNESIKAFSIAADKILFYIFHLNLSAIVIVYSTFNERYIREDFEFNRVHCSRLDLSISIFE